jgi:hypothetical protein
MKKCQDKRFEVGTLNCGEVSKILWKELVEVKSFFAKVLLGRIIWDSD